MGEGIEEDGGRSVDEVLALLVSGFALGVSIATFIAVIIRERGK